MPPKSAAKSASTPVRRARKRKADTEPDVKNKINTGPDDSTADSDGISEYPKVDGLREAVIELAKYWGFEESNPASLDSLIRLVHKKTQTMCGQWVVLKNAQKSGKPLSQSSIRFLLSKHGYERMETIGDDYKQTFRNIPKVKIDNTMKSFVSEASSCKEVADSSQPEKPTEENSSINGKEAPKKARKRSGTLKK